MRHPWLWPVAAFALVGLGLSAAALIEADPGPDRTAPTAEQLVEPADTGEHLWPYTSRRRSVAGRTLALNVVVRGDPEQVRRVLEDRSGADWNATSGEGTVTASPWAPARGAARYTYVTTSPDGDGRWVESTYQLAVGAYLGQRTHIRAYPANVGDWTALQAHTEYWDWFRLRHTVTGVEAGARFVERDLRNEPFVAGVSRVYHGLDGGGSDGWITVVDLVPAVAVAAALPVAAWRRRSLAEGTLPLSLAGLVLGVRAVGITAESLFPAADPKIFAAFLYPVLAAGPPLLVGYLARDRPPERTALLAAGGFGAGLVFDLGVVGVRIVPVRLVLHRVALLGALAVLALGLARADRRWTVAGALAWFLALVGALLGVL